MPLTNKQLQCYIGIDPGQAGGLVELESNDESVIYESMPTTERDIWEWFRTSTSGAIAVIEKVHAMPKQGVSSTFKFGQGFGFLRCCLIASGIPFTEVTPQAWQKAMGIVPRKKTESKLQFKDRLRAKAQQLFPSLPIWSIPKSKGKQLAICDALLITEYCRRKHEGGL